MDKFNIISGVLGTIIGGLFLVKYQEYIMAHRGIVELLVCILISIIIQGIISYMRMCFLKWSYRRNASKGIKKLDTMTTEELVELVKTPIL